MGILYVICAAVIIFLAFKTNLALGLLACAIVIAYAVYKYIPTFWAVKAQKAFEAGDFKESKRNYKKAMDTGRAKLQIRLNYVYVLMRTGDFDEAENLLNPVIRVSRLKKEEYRNMAKQQRCMIYYKTGRLDEAIEDAEEMFNDGYKNTTMYAMLGFFKLLTNKNLNEVTRFCEEAYEYNDEDRDIRDNLSICYYRQGKYEKAKELSDKIIEESPLFVEAYYHGAQIAEAMGDYQRGLELLEHVKDCRRSHMTTVSEEEVEKLRQRLALRAGKRA